MSDMYMNNSVFFENFVADVFKGAGYTIQRNVPVKDGVYGGDIDIIAEKNDQIYCIETKFSRVTNQAVERICSIANERGMIPTFVTASVIEKRKREFYENTYPKIKLVDIENLLFAVKDDQKLNNDLLANLPYSVENIELKQSFLKVDCLQHNNSTIQNLIKELELCQPGREFFTKYEDVCYRLLKNIFAEDLTLWKKQERSNKDLFRFDLFCRIKDGVQKTFWSILERYFNSKYVIFEFKNYKEPITQKEIFTTEKYLYAKALRSVAIIFAANSYDTNAYWAAKGCLRENGKLIILFNTDDLIRMGRMRLSSEDPADYLQEKLEHLLLDLEK